MDCELKKWFFEDQDIYLVSLKEYLETRNNLEENENLWIQDLHLGDPQVKTWNKRTIGPVSLTWVMRIC